MPLQEPESRNILLILPKETLFFIQGTNRNEFSIFYCILKCKGKNTAVRVFKPVYTFRTRFAKSLQMQVCKWKHPMSHGHEDPWQVQLKGHSLLTVQQYSAKKKPKSPGPKKASTLWFRNCSTVFLSPSMCWCWAQAASHLHIQCISETVLLK